MSKKQIKSECGWYIIRERERDPSTGNIVGERIYLSSSSHSEAKRLARKANKAVEGSRWFYYVITVEELYRQLKQSPNS